MNGADLYIGLFWKTYGEYTAEEYKLAETLKKDRLIFQKRTAAESDRAPQLREFLARLNDVEKGLTVHWFDALEDFAKLVKDDVAGWQSDRILERRGPDIDFPLQAPPLPDQYVERRVAEQLKKDLLKGTASLTRAALHGMGGIGKTVTAAAFAHDPDVLERFPDGVLWVTLGKHPDLKQRLVSWRKTRGRSGACWRFGTSALRAIWLGTSPIIFGTWEVPAVTWRWKRKTSSPV